jgi:hypothetical protein
LSSNTLSLCSSLNVRDQVTYPHKNRHNFLLVYFNFHVCRQQIGTRRF